MTDSEIIERLTFIANRKAAHGCYVEPLPASLGHEEVELKRELKRRGVEPPKIGDDLSRAVLAYLKVYDDPIPDGSQRARLRNHLRELVGAPKEKNGVIQIID